MIKPISKSIQLLSEAPREAAPKDWSDTLRLADQIGFQVKPVRFPTGGLNVGQAPTSLLWSGSELFIDVGCRNFDLEHELAHFIVAKASGRDGSVNYKSSLVDESSTVDVQVILALVFRGFGYARKVADDLNFWDCPDRVSETISFVMEGTSKVGLPIQVTEEMLRSFVRVEGCEDILNSFWSSLAWPD